MPGKVKIPDDTQLIIFYENDTPDFAQSRTRLLLIIQVHHCLHIFFLPKYHTPTCDEDQFSRENLMCCFSPGRNIKSPSIEHAGKMQDIVRSSPLGCLIKQVPSRG